MLRMRQPGRSKVLPVDRTLPAPVEHRASGQLPRGSARRDVRSRGIAEKRLSVTAASFAIRSTRGLRFARPETRGMTMQELISHVYAAFNSRDVDAIFAMMSEDVSWPKASEGGRVIGKQGIRDYWTRQWAELDPLGRLLEVIDQESGVNDV